MIVTLYRYPHPNIENRWLYVGQGLKRDPIHRRGLSSFGRRFNKQFPDSILPQPIRWEENVFNQLEANELETIAMFQYHTWRGYEGGMNLTIPGSADYKNISVLGNALVTFENRAAGGHKGGRKTADSGQLAKLRTPEHQRRAAKASGRVAVESGQAVELGRRAVESGQLARVTTPETRAKGGRIGGRKNAESGHLLNICCLKWKIRQGKPCICGRHKNVLPQS